MGIMRYDGVNNVEVSKKLRYDSSKWVDIDFVKRYNIDKWVDSYARICNFNIFAIDVASYSVTKRSDSSVTITFVPNSAGSIIRLLGDVESSKTISIKATAQKEKDGSTSVFSLGYRIGNSSSSTDYTLDSYLISITKEWSGKPPGLAVFPVIEFSKFTAGANCSVTVTINSLSLLGREYGFNIIC